MACLSLILRCPPVVGHCTNKSALAAFLWFSTFAWTASLVIVILQWRSYRSGGAAGRPFQPPDHSSAAGYDDAFDEPRDEEDAYGAIPPPPMTSVHYSDSSYAGRQSGYYGSGETPFADPLPSGYQPASPPRAAQPSYADPCELVLKHLHWFLRHFLYFSDDVIRRELEFEEQQSGRPTTSSQAPQIGALPYDR